MDLKYGEIDLHMHTTFSDGKSDPEAMVLSAISKGLKVVGISDHSYTDFDESYCMQRGRLGEYIEILEGLKAKYAGKIRVLAGIELDIYSDMSGDISAYGLDYAIISAHYLKAGDVYYAVDYTPDILEDMVEKEFAGDWYRAAEAYFDQYLKVESADILGHFDLFSKLNEREKWFDENDPRYIAAWKRAADHLIGRCKAFEINTGAISRGYRSDAYPADPIRRYMRERKAAFILSSDAHAPDSIAYGFDNYRDYYSL